MSIAKLPEFVEYLLVRGKGWLVGIREDAPEHVKKEYEEYVKWQTENPHIRL